MFHTREPWYWVGQLSDDMHSWLFYTTDLLIRVLIDRNNKRKAFCTFREIRDFFFWIKGHGSIALILVNQFSLCRYCWLEFRCNWGFFLPEAPWIRECHCINTLSTPRNPWKAQECFRQNDYVLSPVSTFMWSYGKENSEELWYNLLKKCK